MLHGVLMGKGECENDPSFAEDFTILMKMVKGILNHIKCVFCNNVTLNKVAKFKKGAEHVHNVVGDMALNSR
jgi:hypothetical protein